ncbi:MAG: DUF1552 domain-containing protein [Myxococcota bacterium]|jgi:Protein of unknown function (DUF1552)|nr:DUF1552 domain-containing protein [Myxococcota bacterium]
MKRRIFLKGVGGVALATPFLSSLAEQQAKAQAAAAPPKRLVIFYTHNGCLTNRWFPKVEDGALTADALAGTTLEGLTPFVSKLLVPRGFRSLNGYAVGQSIDPHDQAMGSKLTCATIDQAKSRYATAVSLDHVIAKQINPNKNDPLVLSVGAASTSIKEILSFSAPTTPFPANVNPLTVYTQLTGVFKAGGGATTPPTTPVGGDPGQPPAPTEADWRVARGQSVIDLVKADLGRYQKLNMSQVDKDRVQDWLDLLRTTEVGVVNNGGGMTVTPAACTSGTAEAAPFNVTEMLVQAASPTGKVTAGAFAGGASAEGDKNLATSFTLGGDMMLNLIALSLICDTNRMIMMLYPGYVVFNWDGINHTHDHHGISHRTGDFSVGGACKVAGVLDMILQIDKWYASKYVKLVSLLDSIGEGGGKLLDNTATMWLPELSDGAAHNLNNLPIVIAGSAGGYLKQGAVVNVDSKAPGFGNSEGSCKDGGNIGNTGSQGGNVPINKLYCTLMNAVGCTDESGNKVSKFGAFDGTGTSGGITNPGEVAKLTAAG